MLSTATLGLLAPAVAHADPTDIVISELMYHASDPDGTEFIELYNRGGESVDISSWGFTAGITIATTDLKFPTGTTIPAGGASRRNRGPHPVLEPLRVCCRLLVLRNIVVQRRRDRHPGRR
ncbi:MAG: lamin tail domain-containing protein, partial [Actinomycetota bacterium]|nr:lamin tail domain-containing protein [Actinomycetota bacterium]